MELITNSGAEIAALSFRRMAERFAEDAVARGALLSGAALASDFRYGLRYLERPQSFEIDPVSLSLRDRNGVRGARFNFVAHLGGALRHACLRLARAAGRR